MNFDDLKVNHFPVLRFAVTDNKEAVVLCQRHGDHDEWVTWCISWDGEEVSAFWGHYFHDFDEAEEDFFSRTKWRSFLPAAGVRA